MSRVHGYESKTVYSTDCWTREMGQSPNESNGLKLKEINISVLGHSKMG